MRLGILLIFVLLSVNLSITIINVVPGVNPFSTYAELPNSTNTYDDTLNEAMLNDTMNPDAIDFFTAPIKGFYELTTVIKDVIFGAPSLCLTIANQMFPTPELVNYNGVIMTVNDFIITIVFIIIYLIMAITLIEIFTGREIIGL